MHNDTYFKQCNRCEPCATNDNTKQLTSPHVVVGVHPQVPGPRDSSAHTLHYPIELCSTWTMNYGIPQDPSRSGTQSDPSTNSHQSCSGSDCLVIQDNRDTLLLVCFSSHIIMLLQLHKLKHQITRQLWVNAMGRVLNALIMDQLNLWCYNEMPRNTKYKKAKSSRISLGKLQAEGGSRWQFNSHQWGCKILDSHEGVIERFKYSWVWVLTKTRELWSLQNVKNYSFIAATSHSRWQESSCCEVVSVSTFNKCFTS
jgi:hypothetical protein